MITETMLAQGLDPDQLPVDTYMKLPIRYQLELADKMTNQHDRYSACDYCDTPAGCDECPY